MNVERFASVKAFLEVNSSTQLMGKQGLCFWVISVVVHMEALLWCVLKLLPYQKTSLSQTGHMDVAGEKNVHKIFHLKRQNTLHKGICMHTCEFGSLDKAIKYYNMIFNEGNSHISILNTSITSIFHISFFFFWFS